MVRADVIRKFGNFWNDYVEFREEVEPMFSPLETKGQKKDMVVSLCGNPKQWDRNCSLLAWEVEQERI